VAATARGLLKVGVSVVGTSQTVEFFLHVEADDLFTDGFESGDTSAWSKAVQ